MTFIARAQWGARLPKSNGNAIGAHPLGVAVHYSEGNLGGSPDSLCDDKVRGIQNYHMDAKGWADIAYSFLVCPHGNIFEGRGTGKGSAANGTTQANLDYYAVCALGGPKDTPSVLMLASIGDAIGLCRNAGAGAKVIGHRDLFPTACPGTALYAYVTAGRWTKLPTRPAPPAPTKPPVVVVKPTTKPAPKSTRNIPQTVAIQRACHVVADGKWGWWTQIAATAVIRRTLTNVRYLQARVGTKVDGAWGPNSEAARVNTVRAIQRAIGVTADGKWGPISSRAWAHAAANNLNRF
jgi:hypothetical protein